ncbi:MAG: basic secretory protein-like protein [Pirellulales bacterium]
MNRWWIVPAAFVATCIVPPCLRGEIKTVVNVNRGGDATPDFKFADVPAPSKTDAANAAKFTLLDGRRDGNGGDLDRLNDGRVPDGDDVPRDNFFFAARSSGGRILVDFGKPIAVKAINTYSWHADARGPQVYKLYANDPAAKDIDLKPAADADLAKAGWKLLAEVDTRVADQEPGGQYGVSIRDSAGGDVGEIRYLLFAIARTERDETFDNTFYGEIDVDDGQEHAPAVAAAPTRPETPAEVDVMKIGDKYEIAFDTSQMPEIKKWVDEKLKPVCAEWYPKIVDMLPSEGYTAPRRFTVIFHKDMRGVANTGGTRINCAGDWFMKNLEGEAKGAVVHEMVHVVQQYGRARGRNRNPGWMVEGLADYIRWFLYEPADKRPRVNPARANYTDSYRTTAAFLNYLVDKHDKKIIEKFNAAMREGKYRDELWKELAGNTVDELWGDYITTLRSEGDRRR